MRVLVAARRGTLSNLIIYFFQCCFFWQEKDCKRGKKHNNSNTLSFSPLLPLVSQIRWFRSLLHSALSDSWSSTNVVLHSFRLLVQTYDGILFSCNHDQLLLRLTFVAEGRCVNIYLVIVFIRYLGEKLSKWDRETYH